MGLAFLYDNDSVWMGSFNLIGRSEGVGNTYPHSEETPLFTVHTCLLGQFCRLIFLRLVMELDQKYSGKCGCGKELFWPGLNFTYPQFEKSPEF